MHALAICATWDKKRIFFPPRPRHPLWDCTVGPNMVSAMGCVDVGRTGLVRPKEVVRALSPLSTKAPEDESR